MTYELKQNEKKIKAIKHLCANGDMLDLTVAMCVGTKFNDVDGAAATTVVLCAVQNQELFPVLSMNEVEIPKQIVDEWGNDNSVIYNYAIRSFKNIELE